MRCFLDTHMLIWYFEHDGNLTARAEEIIDNPKNAVYVSVASLWEIAIKVGIGKLEVDFDSLLAQVEKAGFPVMQIKNAFCESRLPCRKFTKTLLTDCL